MAETTGPEANDTRVTEGQRAPATPGALISFPIFGVPVRLHFTFVLLLIFLIILGVSSKQSHLGTTIYVIALFASVLLHELGHVAVSRRYGIKTAEVMMFPIGGVSRMERQPKPSEELWIALAGPMVNLAIALILIAWNGYTTDAKSLGDLLEATDANLIARIAAGNIILAGFNLLPAFPMDGGRILRAFMARRRSEAEATRIAARAGRLISIVLGLVGLLSGNFMLVFIAFFVYLGAVQESAVVTGRTLLSGVQVRAAMITDYKTLSHGSTLREASDLLLSTSQQDFPVTHGSQVVGLLTRTHLLKGMSEKGADAYVAGAMERDFDQVTPESELMAALPYLQNHCVLVMENGELVGMLTRENLAEFLMVRKFVSDPKVA